MNKILEELRPVEKLYLISKEREDILNKKTVCSCLISFLVKNNNVKNDLSIKLDGELVSTGYEDTFMNLYLQKKYIELDKFLDNLKVFNKTLIEKGILAKEIRVKKFLFIKLAKEKVSFNTLYYKLQAHFGEKLDNGEKPVNVVCGEINKELVLKFYGKMVNQIKEAYKKEEEEKNKK